ncbi:TSUP family transporter, partial [Massilia sp. WF1]|uniref:TSUP family transporter n=2 Tax=unclassified Massilia TaxID=2609279 RepID=UPI000B2E0F97
MISITDLLSSFRGVNLAGLVIVVGVAAAFVAGGIVKGILGVGLPLVMVPALSLVMPAPQAISLLAIPVLAANLWQAIDSGVAIGSLRRFFPLLAALVGATLVTVPLALAMPSGMLTLMVALAVLLAALSMAFR